MDYVPAADYAVVAESKITGYLLSTEHRLDGSRLSFSWNSDFG
jgi:hypothetical protein